MSSLLYDTHWAVTEFADAELGDLRRTQRLVELAGVLAQHPTAALPEACGDGAMLKAAYRFFDNDAVEPQDVLLSHIEATYGRLAQVPLVLAVQDTTEVDWTAHPATQNLGPLGHSACRGLMVHSTLAFTPERVPLGLLAQQVWARDPDDIGKRHRRKQLPISQKESQKWLTSLDAVFTARAECPQTRLVSVGDREADVYDVLAAERPEGVELLIRASWDRCTRTPERYVWATVEAQAVVEQLLLQVPRRGAQPAREATLALRFCPLTLCPPRHRQREGLSEVGLWAVQVVEVDPPADVTPIEWMLLTTVAVDTVQEAIERVEWYGGRWGIEIYQSCNLRRTLFGSKMHFLGSSRAQLVNILDSVSYTLPPQTTTPSVFPLQPHFDHRYASCAISCEGVAPLVLGHLRASSRFASSRPRACRGLRRGLGGGPPPGARRLPPLA